MKRDSSSGSSAGRPQHDDLGTGVRYADDGVQELALQDRPALSLEAQPGEEGRHGVEISDGDADVIEVPDRRHGVHPPVFVRPARFSLVRLSAGTARPWQAHGSRVCVADGVDDQSPLRPRRRPLCKRHYTTRWNVLICRRQGFQAAMALAPLCAGACRTGFVILTAKPIAGHAQRASGGNSGQDDPAAAGALGLDPGRRQAPALDHRHAPHPGRRPCRRTPQQNRPPLRSSKRLPGTSVSLPGITLSDKGGQGERAHCRRYARPGRAPDRTARWIPNG